MYISFHGTQIANRNPHGKFTMQLRMRKEEASICIDTVHNPFIERSQLCLIIHSLRMSAETNSTERCRSHALKIPRFINPLREKPAQANMFAYAGSQSLLPKIAHNHPEFERTEAATERSAIIHSVRRYQQSAVQGLRSWWKSCRQSQPQQKVTSQPQYPPGSLALVARHPCEIRYQRQFCAAHPDPHLARFRPFRLTNAPPAMHSSASAAPQPVLPYPAAEYARPVLHLAR